MIQRICSSTAAAVVQTAVCCAAVISFFASDRLANGQTLQGGPASPASNPPAAVTQPAQVQPYEQTEILAKASGFVSRVFVDIGDRVEKDQMLAELWIPEMVQERLVAVATVDEAAAMVRQMEAAIAAAKAKLHEEQASVARYQADVDLRRSEHDRIAHLVAERALNEGLLDEKRSQLKSADSARAAADAAVRSAEANIQVESANLSHAHARQKLAEANLKKVEVLMSYAQVRAPFDGLVTHRGIDTGDFVASAAGNAIEPVFTVCSVDRLRIVVDMPESQAPLIRLGQRTMLVVDALKNKSFRGAIKRSAGVLDARTRTLRVEAELDSPADELRPGMFGSLTIELTPPQAGN